ncbi:hypothetical protein [Acinetobacter bereziniae]|uniref:hypothetical protein n=1 Tax=Acinetobacter bereziniae TaxID=106648 RepID=UPI0012508519|nr:hypothetical protein [Acinetobacter bereziniae]
MIYISEAELKTLKFEDLYKRRIVIHRISLLRDGGVLMTKWLHDNEHLVLKKEKISSKSRWGREWSHLKDTAFFNLESSYSDGCPDGCLITPIYKIPESLTAEQISQTPTLSELFLGLVKKYPEQFHHIHAAVRNDLDDVAYLEWMHPKALIKGTTS